MDNIDLKYATNLEPKKAIEYFESKGHQVTWDWHEMLQDAHAKAFTVAKVTKMDILQDIREAVQKSIDEGETFEQFKANLEPKLKAKGWWGKIKQLNPNTGLEEEVQLGSLWRLKTIYQTNLNVAYQAGRYKEMMDNIKNRPYWMYVAVLDSRTRLAHGALDGLVFKFDDPFWNSHYPPNGWHCRCKVRAINQTYIDKNNISVQNTQGKLADNEVPVSKDNKKKVNVTTYTTADGTAVTPDPGWSYNPGKSGFANIQRKYDPSIRNAYKAELIAKTEKEAIETGLNLNINADYNNDINLANIVNQAVSDVRDYGYTDHFIFDCNPEDFKDNNYEGFYDQTSNKIHIKPPQNYIHYLNMLEDNYKEKVISTPSYKHIVYHEIGHYLHNITPTELKIRALTLDEKVLIKHYVSNNALIGSNEKEIIKEFTAEVYAGIIYGQHYNDDIMNLYKEFGGP